MEPNSAADLALQFRELGTYIDAGSDPQEALRRVVVLARDTVDGCDWGAVTRAGSRARTLAATDDTAEAIDDLQRDLDEGPCLTAARDDVVVHIPDLAAEQRWPEFRTRALAETPLRALLSFEVSSAPSTPTALNLYGGEVDPFDDQAIATAALFTTHTQLAMLHLNAVSKGTNLREALTTSRLIGEAVGVLMATRKLTSEQAFELLRTSSQNLNRKLRDVAVDVTDTGELPGRQDHVH